MASSSQGLYPSAQSIRSMASVSHTGDMPLQIAIGNALTSAISSRLYTTTINLGAYSQQQISNQMRALRGLGYQTSYSGSTLTISW